MWWQAAQEMPSRASPPKCEWRRVLPGIGDRVDRLAQEVRAGLRRVGRVDDELPLALDAVAAEAGVLHLSRTGRVEGLRLAGELGEEDRVAAGEAHRAGAPGTVGREVVQGLGVWRSARSCRIAGRCRRRCGSRRTGPR